VDEEIRLAAERDGRTPGLPAVRRAAGVERGTQQADHDVVLHDLDYKI
jgi:hypothetical protein